MCSIGLGVGTEKWLTQASYYIADVLVKNINDCTNGTTNYLWTDSRHSVFATLSRLEKYNIPLDQYQDMYDKMAQEAREEGFDHIADLFEGVAKIEKEHEERYKKLLENLENGLVFSKDGDKIWKCRNCGHICVGKEAPEVCPVCAHPKAYFEIKAENY